MDGSQPPCFPSQASLIPLHDGHVLPSPAAEHNEDTVTHASFGCLAEQLCLPNPPVGSIAAPSQTPNTVKALRCSRVLSCPLSDLQHDNKSLLASQAVICTEGERQSLVHIAHETSSFMATGCELSSTTRTVPAQQGLRSSNITPSSLYHFVRQTWSVIFSYVIVGIAMTAASRYYYA